MSWYRKKKAEHEIATYSHCERIGLRPRIGDYMKMKDAQRYLDRVHERERQRSISDRLDRYQF